MILLKLWRYTYVHKHSAIVVYGIYVCCCCRRRRRHTTQFSWAWLSFVANPYGTFYNLVAFLPPKWPYTISFIRFVTLRMCSTASRFKPFCTVIDCWCALCFFCFQCVCVRFGKYRIGTTIFDYCYTRSNFISSFGLHTVPLYWLNQAHFVVIAVVAAAADGSTIGRSKYVSFSRWC